MSRRGVTLPEILIVVGLVAVIGGSLLSGLGTFTRQSNRASEKLRQTHEALILMDVIHQELASIVLNPVPNDRDHQDNSFIISQPNATSIQFVTQVHTPTGVERRLVYYEAHTAAPGARGALGLKKLVWAFKNDAPWTQKIAFPPGWPSAWIGPVLENQEDRYKSLGLEDMRWQALLPASGQRELFFRVKIVLRDFEGGSLLPFTTLVGVPLPVRDSDASECPCLMAPCFDLAKPDCGCCQGM